MLIDKTKACIMALNIQQHMLPLVANSERFVKNSCWLNEMAADLEVPVIATVHRGLGEVLAPFQAVNPAVELVEKTMFCASEDALCRDALGKLNRPQIILSGMEAHVCVMQTALHLHEHGKQVFVVADAITARGPQDIELAIERMRAAGVVIITKEMFMFEGLRRSDSELYGRISAKYFSRKD